MTDLVLKIKEKMHEEGLTAYSLERSAGLKPNAVHNILSGRSKNPSINVLQTISQALNCTVSDLIGDRSGLASQIDGSTSKETVVSTIINQELYVRCLCYFAELLRKSKHWMEKEQILDCVDEIYQYSFKKGLSNVDTHFAKWFFERTKN